MALYSLNTFVRLKVLQQRRLDPHLMLVGRLIRIYRRDHAWAQVCLPKTPSDPSKVPPRQCNHVTADKNRTE